MVAHALSILTFHAIDDRASPISFPPAAFESGLRHLADAGWSTIRLTDAVEHVRRGAAFPDRRIVITFDDGYRSVHDVAFPLLREHGMTATVFLPTGEAPDTGDGSRLPAMEEREMLSWGEIREMAAAGIDFGGHTMTHPFLTQVDRARLEHEVRGCQAVIEDALGRPASTFAYPDGRHDVQARTIVADHYDCAVSTRLGQVTADSDPFALERIETFYFRRPKDFARLTSPRLGAYLRRRAFPRAIKRLLRGG